MWHHRENNCSFLDIQSQKWGFPWSCLITCEKPEGTIESQRLLSFPSNMFAFPMIVPRFAISARAVHLIALEPKVRSFGTLAVLVQTSPRCWDFGAQTKETTKATKARQMRSPQPGARMPSTHKKVLKSPTKKDDQHTRCSAKMPMTYLVKAVKNKLGALKGAKA